MDLQAERNELVKLLLDTDSPEIMNRIRSVFKGEEYDFYDDLPDHVKADIDIALDEIKKGEVDDHEDVMRDF